MLRWLLLVLLAVEWAEAYTYKLACSHGMGVGVSGLMGTGAASTSRSVIIKNAQGTDVTGTTIAIDSSSSFSVHLSSTSGGIQYMFQISGATFSGGSCGGSRTSMNAQSFSPTQAGTVSVFVGYASGYYGISISPSATVTFTGASNPTFSPTPRPTSLPVALPTLSPTYEANEPTPQPTPRPTPAPSLLPTIYTGIERTYVIACTFTLQGAGVGDVQNQGLSLMAVLSAKLGVASTNVAIVSVSSAPMSLLWRRLAMGGSASVAVNIMGYTSSTVAATAATTLSTYLGSSSFVSDLVYSSGLAVTGVTVTSQPTVGDVSVAAFPYQCRLNSHLTLWWAAPSASSSGGSQVSAMLSMDSGSSWFSGGVVRRGETQMVSSTSTNKVFLYSPSASKLGCYSMNAKSASGFSLDAAMRTGTGITAVQTLPSSASMSFTLSTSTGVASDTPIVLGPGTYNTYIWAHGGAWPATHDSGNYGFVDVFWSDGRCERVAKTRSVSAGFIFVLLLLVAIFNSPYSPFTKLLEPLHSTRLPLPFVHEYSLSGLGMLALFFAFCLVVLFTNSSGGAVVSLASLTSASGQVAILSFWLALIPTSKTSATLWIFGVPFERACKYHKVVATTGLAFALVHLFSNLQANAPVFYSTDKFGENGVRPLYGLLGFLAFAAMSLMAVPWIRTYHHEVFKLFHYLYWVGVALIIVHTSSGLLGLGFVPGLLLHGLDKVRRVWLLLWPLRPVAVSKVADHTLTVTQLTLPRQAKYVHGQYYYLHIHPAACHGQTSPLSLIEWHPISVSGIDAHGPDTVTFHVKSNGPGTWSGRLSQATTADSVALDGPFGNLSVDLADQSMRSVVLVCGGIGCTPFLSILQDVVANNAGAYTHLERLHLVWSVRELELLEAFRPQLEALVAAARASEGKGKSACLVVDIYQTAGGTRGDGVSSSSSSSSGSGGKDYSLVGSTRWLELATWQAAPGSAPGSAMDYHQGRPDLQALVAELKADERSRRVNDGRARNCVLVCGPGAMAATVQCAAAANRLLSHMEVFSL